jgi:antitoxin HigA-1
MPRGDSTDLLLSPRTSGSIFKPSCLCLEKPIKTRARSASYPSFILLHLAWPHVPHFASPLSHPGEILHEEFLKPLGMTANALSVALRVSAPRINDIVREKRSVSVETAMRLGRYFNTTAGFWLNLQTAYDLRKTEALLGATIEQEVSPRKTASEMV